ncbi:MAG: hypothetical protein GEV11_23880 [Streptosporangiales bacterium]|nr:hypothetical protein [Streptosporangiales bacterium]
MTAASIDSPSAPVHERAPAPRDDDPYSTGAYTPWQQRGRDLAGAVKVLVAELSGLGFDHLYWAIDERVGLVSVRTGLTVWVHESDYRWNEGRQAMRWPLQDPAGAAVRIRARSERLRADRPE